MHPWELSTSSGNGLLTVDLDEELTRYRLLAYLQRVERRYDEQKLYPHLDELHTRLVQLRALRADQERLQQASPGEVTGIDLQHGELIRSGPDMPKALRALDAIIDRALPALQQLMDRGTELRLRIAGHIHFAPVGLLPLRTTEGYLLLRQGREATVYQYDLTLLHGTDPELEHHNVRTRYVTSCTVRPGSTYHQIKTGLVRRLGQLPNPATFVFESDITLPRMETFMPLAKRLVYRAIAPGIRPDPAAPC